MGLCLVVEDHLTLQLEIPDPLFLSILEFQTLRLLVPHIGGTSYHDRDRKGC